MSAADLLTRPCARCPFRDDVPNYLRRDRRRSILREMQSGKDFHCHKTVDYSHENDEGETIPDVSDSSLCAGASLLFLRNESEPGGQVARIALRLDPKYAAALDACTTPIRSWESWRDGGDDDSNEPEDDDESDDEPRVCNTVDDDCTAPAGWGGYGGVMANDDADAEHDCRSCGEPVCAACARPDPESDGVLCGNCAAWDEPDESHAEVDA